MAFIFSTEVPPNQSQGLTSTLGPWRQVWDRARSPVLLAQGPSELWSCSCRVAHFRAWTWTEQKPLVADEAVVPD